MTWEEFQPRLKDLNGKATIIVSRDKIKTIREEMYRTKGWQPQDIIMNFSGVKDARFMGYIGFVYRVPDHESKGTLGKIPTVELEGRMIYSKNDAAQHVTMGIIVPIEAIEAIKEEGVLT